jgi:hypothetical protein
MPAPSGVTLVVKDERTVTLPATLPPSQINVLVRVLSNMASADYSLWELSPIQEDRGTQRDPYVVTTGMKMVFRKVS